MSISVRSFNNIFWRYNTKIKYYKKYIYINKQTNSLYKYFLDYIIFFLKDCLGKDIFLIK